MAEQSDFLARGNWQKRLDQVVSTMREMSLQKEPKDMVRIYSRYMRSMLPLDRWLSISRRGVEAPKFIVARDSARSEEIDPWIRRDELPVVEGGLLGELMFCNEPRIIEDLQVSPRDPTAHYFEGQRSLISIPVWDGGVALNVTVQMREKPRGFDPEVFPLMVWMSNLFGRATHNLVLSHELGKMHEALDSEHAVVGDLQRSLLPGALPAIPTMGLAAHYETSSRAGGDYYDVLELPDGKWGILMADVSGHGSPAAMLMAVSHAVVHLYDGSPDDPAALLGFLNRALTERYTGGTGNFVTAFYGVYDAATREFVYSLAGHPPPRLKHCDDGSLDPLDGASRLPLGIMADQVYVNTAVALRPGDQMVLYTDGITEARNAAGEMFGPSRLDHALHDCHLDSEGLIATVLETLAEFTSGQSPDDDRTMVVAKIR